MKRLARIPVATMHGASEIALYHGDLTAIPEDEAVDLLVVSAFPGDYTPTPTSLIGALHHAGVSLQALAYHKEADLRTAFASWLSSDLGSERPGLAFRRIMCFEPRSRGRAPEVIGDFFRALTPFVPGPPHVGSVAMPLLASGDQAEGEQAMLAAMRYSPPTRTSMSHTGMSQPS